MDIVVRAVQSRDELGVANGLFAAQLDPAHSTEQASFVAWLGGAALRYPGFKQEHMRIAVRKNEIVGALRLATDTLRVGEARLKAGGIANIAVSEHNRKRGVPGLLLDDAMAYMRQHNYHVAALFGLPGLHERSGFTPAIADYAVVLETLEALTFEVPYRLRPARPGDIAALLKLHNAGDADSSASVVRVAGHFACKWECTPDFQVLLSDEGRVVAYFRARSAGNALDVEEAGLTDFGAAAALVGACARAAADASLGTIRFCVPPFHPLARYLGQFDARHETHTGRRSGGMMALVSVADTLEHMVPEWEGRVARSAVRDERTEVTLAVNGTYYCIRANKGAIDVSTTPGTSKVGLSENELMQLLVGYSHLETIFDTRRCFVHPSARTFLTALFPKRTPYVWPFDRF